VVAMFLTGLLLNISSFLHPTDGKQENGLSFTVKPESNV